LQFGRHIIKDEEGGLCFFATPGVDPLNKERLLYKLGKKLEGKLEAHKMPSDLEFERLKYPEDSLPFQSGREWKRDFYNFVWDMWDEDTFNNLNLVVQLVQLKETCKNPTISSDL